MRRGNHAFWATLAASLLAAAPASVLARADGGVMVLQPGALDAATLPSLITTAPGRFLRGTELLRACASVARRNPLKRLVLELDGMRCSAEDAGNPGVPGRFDSWAGRAVDHQIERELVANGYALVPQARRPAQPKYTCGCPTNRGPDGVVVCVNQTADQSRAIAPVEFLAEDADGDPLKGFFSHTRDGGSAMEGEPPGLLSRCSAGTGALACELSGRALGGPGQLAISWAVSDGLEMLSLQALITVAPGPDGGLLFDGFEIPVCQ